MEREDKVETGNFSPVSLEVPVGCMDNEAIVHFLSLEMKEPPISEGPKSVPQCRIDLVLTLSKDFLLVFRQSPCKRKVSMKVHVFFHSLVANLNAKDFLKVHFGSAHIQRRICNVF